MLGDCKHRAKDLSPLLRGDFHSWRGGRNEQLPLQRAARSQKMREQSESPVQTGPSTRTLRAAALRDGTGTPPRAAVPPARGFVAVGRGTASSNSPPGLVGVFVLAVRL